MAEADKPNPQPNTLELLTKHVFSLHEILLCVVCLEVPQAPVQQCVSGHITCQQCARRLELCATCKQHFTVRNSTCINNMLRALPRFCDNKDAGCDKILLPKSEDDEHAALCQFRSICCPVCMRKVNICKLKQHCDEKHARVLTEVVRYKEAKMFWKLDLKESDERCRNIFLEGSFLNTLEEYLPKENKFRITFVVLMQGMNGGNYHLKINFKKDEYEFTKTLRPLILTGTNMIVQLESMKNIPESTMEIPLCFMHHFMTKSQVLCFTYTFF